MVPQLAVELLPLYFSTNTKIRRVDTRTHYERSFRQFAAYLGAALSLDHFTDDNASGFLIWSLAQGVCEVTANQRCKQIRAFWEWAARRRYIDAFPTFTMLDEPDQMPIAYQPGQVPQLFAACKKRPGYIAQFPAELWWLSQQWWFWATGERTEATLLLAPEMIDLHNAIARVPAKIRKGSKKNMAYRLPPRLCELLAELFRYPNKSGLVWPRHFSISAYYHRHRALVESAGLPTTRGKCGPQKMRITVLTMIRALGGDATAFAKHDSRQTTDESYIDEALVLAMQKGVWPPKDINPEKPGGGGWFSRLFGRAG